MGKSSVQLLSRPNYAAQNMPQVMLPVVSVLLGDEK